MVAPTRMSERTFADYRITRVAVDVENRSEIDMYAHAPALLPYGAAVFVKERIVLNGS